MVDTQTAFLTVKYKLHNPPQRRRARFRPEKEQAFRHSGASCAQLRSMARRMTRSPRPLEIEAAQMPGHIDHFTNEIQPRHIPALHGF